MYTPATPQTLSVIGDKVNLLLSASPFNSLETWMLPQVRILYIVRYIRNDHGDTRSETQATKEMDERAPQVKLLQSYSDRTSGASNQEKPRGKQTPGDSTTADPWISSAPSQAGYLASARKSDVRIPEAAAP